MEELEKKVRAHYHLDGEVEEEKTEDLKLTPKTEKE